MIMRQDMFGIKLPLMIVSVIFLILEPADCFPAPQQYTEQPPTSSQFSKDAYRLRYSPDQLSLAYLDSSFKTVVKFRPFAWNDTETVVDTGKQVTWLAFSPQGSRLYIMAKNTTSQTYYLMSCSIDKRKINQTVVLMYTFALGQYIFRNPSIDIITSRGNIAVGINKHLYMFQGTGDDSIRLYDTPSVRFMDYYVADLQWHPTDSNTLFVSFYDGDSTYSAFYRYNWPSKELIQIQRKAGWGVAVLMDGSIVLQSLYNQIKVWTYLNGTMTYKFTIQNLTTLSTLVSVDRKSFIATQYHDQGNSSWIYRLTLTQETGEVLIARQNTRSDSLHSLNLENLEQVNFNSLLNISFAAQLRFLGISPTGNEVLFLKANTSLLKRWSRCGDGFYFINDQCFNCSSRCKTCHTSSFQCTSCQSNSFLNSQGDCQKCSELYQKCASCLLSNQTIECENCSNGYQLDETTKKCICPSGFKVDANDTCTKIPDPDPKPKPNPDGNSDTDGVNLKVWQILVVLGVIVALNVVGCFGVVYWTKRRLMRRQNSLANGIGNSLIGSEQETLGNQNYGQERYFEQSS